jgi:cytochrome c551/c552
MFPRAMLFSLATANKIGLAVMGGLFIAFALVSSFVVPARNPNFPGRGLRWYVLVCIAFFVAMMSAVLVLAKEEPKAETGGAEEPAGSAEGPPPAATGDSAAGKVVFTSGPCGSCHKFEPAGTTGAVGPPLDDLKPSADEAGEPLPEFVEESITKPDEFIATGYQKGVMPPNGGATLTPKQLEDLVAFIVEGQK